MNRHGPFLALGLAFAALAGGLAMLFRLRLAQGDVFPTYSSLRADPLGTRALYDGLAQLPSMSVDRRFQPLDALQSQLPRTLVMAGVEAQEWTHITRDEFDALNNAVRSGVRLVIAMKAESVADQEERQRRDAATARAKKESAEKSDRKEPPTDYADLRLRWGAQLKERMLMERGTGAARTDEPRAVGLPERVTWQSDVFFDVDPASGWRVIYRRGGEPVLVERELGRGSIVLAADSYFLSNEALQRNRSTTLLAWIVGAHQRVTFDESHLGVVAHPGVAALARRYGLSGAFFTLLLLAALFVWRRMALFVPPAHERRDVALVYHPAAGLEALLRRAVPVKELAATCAAEWRTGARDGDRARVDAALADAPKNASPVVLYNAAVRALRRR